MSQHPIRYYLITVVIVSLLWQPPSIGKANNNFFLPGDAFFYTVLTEDALAEIKKSNSPIFRYQRPEHLRSFFCGYAGFEQLQVKDMSPDIKKNLAVVYRTIREGHPLQIELVPEVKVVEGDLETIEVKTGKILRREINGISMFFYNADFDADRYRLALKYNETWVEEVVAFGHRQEHVRFDFFLPQEEAVMSCWRDAKQVKPLNVIAPPIKVRRSSNPLPPIMLNGKVRIFVLPSNDFLSHYHRSKFVYEVTEAGIQLYGPPGIGGIGKGMGRGIGGGSKGNDKWTRRPFGKDD